MCVGGGGGGDTVYVGHMVKDHSDSERGDPRPPRLTARVILYTHPTYRITHATAFDTPVVDHWLEREIAQWVHPMMDRSDDPSHHERTLLPRSYILLPTCNKVNKIFLKLISYLIEIQVFTLKTSRRHFSYDHSHFPDVKGSGGGGHTQRCMANSTAGELGHLL